MIDSTTRQDLLNRIARGEVKQVIETLLSRKDLHEDRHKELIAISARHRRLKSGRRMGLLSFQEDHITETQIIASLVDLIELPTDAPFPEEKSIDHKVPLRVVWWKYIVAAGVIVGLLAGITTLFINIGRIVGPGEYSTNSLTVLVHGEKGIDHRILPNRGIVTLIYGNAIVSEQINNQGEAVFAELDNRFFGPDANVKITFQDPVGDPYRALHPDSLYRLEKGNHIDLAVKLHNIDKIKGIVREDVTSEPIDSVRVSVAGVATFTDPYGEFRLYIPDSLQREFQTIRATKAGYAFYESQNVPVVTGVDVPILMKKKKE
jgi:Effector-associated domain 11